MVSTHVNFIHQIASFPQVGLKIKKIFETTTCGNFWMVGKWWFLSNIAIFGIYVKFLRGNQTVDGSEIRLTSWGWYFTPCFVDWVLYISVGAGFFRSTATSDKSKSRNIVVQTFHGYSIRVIIWNPARTAGFVVAKKGAKKVDPSWLSAALKSWPLYKTNLLNNFNEWNRPSSHMATQFHVIPYLNLRLGNSMSYSRHQYLWTTFNSSTESYLTNQSLQKSQL